jgi:hypothetical protein
MLMIGWQRAGKYCRYADAWLATEQWWHIFVEWQT